MAEQEREQLEGLRLDRERLAVAQDAVAGEVDLDRARGRRSAGGASSRGAACSAAAEQRPDPGRQLAQAERLRDVVVGAELEPDDLVELAVLAP